MRCIASETWSGYLCDEKGLKEIINLEWISRIEWQIITMNHERTEKEEGWMAQWMKGGIWSLVLKKRKSSKRWRWIWRWGSRHRWNRCDEFGSEISDEDRFIGGIGIGGAATWVRHCSSGPYLGPKFSPALEIAGRKVNRRRPTASNSVQRRPTASNGVQRRPTASYGVQ